jgi:aryl-alcohol dehydrogenase-like predicted oxidoreductase
VRPAQLAIAWVRAKAAAQGVTLVPLLGARTRQQLGDALAGLDLNLTAADVSTLETAVPASEVAGARYPAQQMAHLDSER